MPRRKFDTTQRGISDTHTDAPIATSICENKLVYAERIRTLRAAANLSQGELAEAMNLGRAAISNWETGRTRPDIANIPRLCNVLGITVAAFFSDTPEEAGWNDAERALMRNYRKLSAINQDLLSATAQTMVALEEQYPGLPKRPAAPKLTPEPARLALLELPYADDPVAAGTGDSGFAASGHTTFLHATKVRDNCADPACLPARDPRHARRGHGIPRQRQQHGTEISRPLQRAGEIHRRAA